MPTDDAPVSGAVAWRSSISEAARTARAMRPHNSPLASALGAVGRHMGHNSGSAVKISEALIIGRIAGLYLES